MPYIDEHAKRELRAGRRARTVGELTYQIQRDLKQYLKNHDHSYSTMAEILGALEGAKADFVERVLKPYEQRKCDQNGDVW